MSCITLLPLLANQQIRHQAKLGCQPGDFAYGHFNLPPEFVWVYMGEHTHFITPERERRGGGGGGNII